MRLWERWTELRPAISPNVPLSRPVSTAAVPTGRDTREHSQRPKDLHTWGRYLTHRLHLLVPAARGVMLTGAEFSVKHSNLEGRHSRLSPEWIRQRLVWLTCILLLFFPCRCSFHTNRYMVTQKFSWVSLVHNTLSYEQTKLEKFMSYPVFTESKIPWKVSRAKQSYLPQTIKLWIENPPTPIFCVCVIPEASELQNMVFAKGELILRDIYCICQHIKIHYWATEKHNKCASQLLVTMTKYLRKTRFIPWSLGFWEVKWSRPPHSGQEAERLNGTRDKIYFKGMALTTYFLQQGIIFHHLPTLSRNSPLRKSEPSSSTLPCIIVPTWIGSKPLTHEPFREHCTSKQRW